MFTAKQRARDLELPVPIATTRRRGRSRCSTSAERVARACWPGPLTIVLPRGAAASSWDLGGDPATVGVRAPRHPVALAILGATGPLAVTSANRSGEPPATTCDDLHATFDDVAVYLCEDAAPRGAASTVLDLAHGPARILRDGSASRAALATLLPGEPSLLDSRPSS